MCYVAISDHPPILLIELVQSWILSGLITAALRLIHVGLCGF